MTPRQINLRERKDTVLGIVVNEYINHVAPVSSGHIAHNHLMELSTATIRNILAELEDDGYLTHPHTSSGRIPTEQGYRYYVNHLMNEISLLEEHKRQLKEQYDRQVRDLEQLLEKTTEMISGFTHYTSIVTVDGSDQRIFCSGTRYVVEYPDHPDIQKIRDILALLEQKEQLLTLVNRELERRVDVFIGHELACRATDSCSMAVSRYRLNNGCTGRLAVLGPTHMDYQKVVSTLEYFSNVIQELM